MRSLLLIASVIVTSVCRGQHFEQLPDFRAAYDAERVLIIPEGETVAFPSGNLDLVWIEGTCLAPRDADLDLTVSEIIVAPTGRLDMGTEASPCLGTINVTFADGGFIPGDNTQWGHGLIVAGDITCWGAPKAVWSEVSGPDVVNVATDLESNVTFLSANPNGTRGHTVYTDHANVSIGNTAFVGLGRTRPEPLGSSNLVARYPIHFHHSMGPNRKLQSVVVDGLDYKSKWGIVVHGSSWVSVLDCVVTRVGGAGFVTEDGSEVGNRFDGNLAFDCSSGAKGFPIGVHEGFHGAGFWFKSMAQFIDNNVSMNNFHGFQSAVNRHNGGARDTPDNVPQMAYQISPGGPMTGEITAFQTTLSGQGNRFVNNSQHGYDGWAGEGQSMDQGSAGGWWSLVALPIQWEDCTFANNGNHNAGHSATENCALYTDCQFADDGRGVGAGASISYHRFIYLDGCAFTGLRTGTITGRGGIISNCVFDTDVGIEYNGRTSQLWRFGITAVGNVFTGEPFSIVNATQEQFDAIEPHGVTLAEVYANVQEFRDSIGVAGPPDPNDEERDRLMAEIAAVQAQIAVLTAELADLQQQLDNL